MLLLSPDMELERRQDCTCPYEAPGATHPMLGDKCFSDCLAAFLSSRFDQAHINDVVCRLLQESEGGDALYPLYYLDQKWCGLVPKSSLGQDPNVDNIINTCNGLNFPNLTDPGVPPPSYQCNLCTRSTSSEASRPTANPVMHLSSTSASLTTTEPTTLELSSSSTSSPATSTKAAVATTPTGPTTVGPEYSFPTTASTTTVPYSRNQLPTEAIIAIAVCTALAVSGAVLLLCCVLRRRQKQQEDYSSDMRRRISRIMQDFTIPPASSPQPLISPTQSYTADRPPLTPPLRLRDRKLLPSLLRPLSRPESIVFGPPFDTHHSNYSNSSYYSSQSQKKVDKGGGASFPASPICSPTYDKLEPQQEKTHKKAPSSLVNSAMSLSPEPSSPPYTQLKSPPPVGFTFPPRYSPENLHHHQYTGSPPRKGTSSSSSLLRKANTSTSTTSSDYNQDYQSNSKTSSIGTEATVVGPQEQTTHGQQQHPPVIFTSRASPTPPSSPTRPRRPHDEPLEIPDLVSPLTTTTPTSSSPGPPPNRALPPPPMPGSGRSSSAASEIGIATTTTTVPNMTSAVTRRSPGSVSLRSLQEQEQEEDHDHHRSSGSGPGEGKRSRTVSRDSWGSWEDTSGDRSIVGVAMSPSLSGSLSGRGVGTVFPYPDH